MPGCAPMWEHVSRVVPLAPSPSDLPPAQLTSDAHHGHGLREFGEVGVLCPHLCVVDKRCDSDPGVEDCAAHSDSMSCSRSGARSCSRPASAGASRNTRSIAGPDAQTERSNRNELRYGASADRYAQWLASLGATQDGRRMVAEIASRYISQAHTAALLLHVCRGDYVRIA
jgi:hypothetical protein